MKANEKNCPHCGAEISDPKVKKCPSCGAKTGKPIFKKWWFWLIVILGVAIIGSAVGTNTDSDQNGNGDSDNNGSGGTSSTIEYTVTDIQQMIDDLKANALKAENTYQNKYVQITGKIANFDSDGTYISLEAVNASEWNFDTVMCYIKKDAQRDFLMEKSVGDTITVKGKIIRIGELLGYSINIDEVS